MDSVIVSTDNVNSEALLDALEDMNSGTDMDKMEDMCATFLQPLATWGNSYNTSI